MARKYHFFDFNLVCYFWKLYRLLLPASEKSSKPMFAKYRIEITGKTVYSARHRTSILENCLMKSGCKLWNIFTERFPDKSSKYYCNTANVKFKTLFCTSYSLATKTLKLTEDLVGKTILVGIDILENKPSSLPDSFCIIFFLNDVTFHCPTCPFFFVSWFFFPQVCLVSYYASKHENTFYS